MRTTLWLIGRRFLRCLVWLGAGLATLIVFFLLFLFARGDFYSTFDAASLPPGVVEPDFLMTLEQSKTWDRMYPTPAWIWPVSNVFGLVAATLCVIAFWMFVFNAHLLFDWLEWRIRRTWRFLRFIRDMYTLWDGLEPDPYGER